MRLGWPIFAVVCWVVIFSYYLPLEEKEETVNETVEHELLTKYDIEPNTKVRIVIFEDKYWVQVKHKNISDVWRTHKSYDTKEEALIAKLKWEKWAIEDAWEDYTRERVNSGNVEVVE